MPFTVEAFVFGSRRQFLRRSRCTAAGLLPVLLIAGCSVDESPMSDLPVSLVEETFITREARGSNLDSPAIWLGPSGETWLITTGKSSNRLHVVEAASGAPIRTVGQRGRRPGEFRRPNGIAILGDFVLIVERDNARVQLLRLPDFEPVAIFGAGTLRKPYGIALLQRSATEAEVFITDDYRGFAGRSPPDRELGQRVKHFLVVTGDQGVGVTYLGAFGDTTGGGRLSKVESVAIDPDAGVLLVADEAHRDVKLYRTDGSFTGQVLWSGLFRHDPEGIALYACGPDDGYWIAVDQDVTENRFLVFQRRSFELVGAFRGTVVRNTDGVGLIQRPVGSMSAGVLYAIHNDRAVGAFSWSAVAEALELRFDCEA